MTVDVRYCPHCGTRRTGYFRFCGRCGLDFDELTIGKPPEATEPKPEPTTPIWPPPAQWPPPDAAPPPPEAESQPQPVVRSHQQAPILALPPPQLEAPSVGPVPVGPVVSRRPAVTWTRISIVVLAALLGVSAISRAMTTSSGSTPRPTVAVGTPLIVASASLSAPPADGSTPGPSFGPTGQTQLAVVTTIVDGDTIRVTIDGTEYPVRYIGIDAPEPDATDPTVKQLADAAMTTNAALVEGQDVVLERDVSDTDQFDRLLRNVWLVDSGGSQVLVNLELVRLGFAAVTTFPPDDKYAALLMSAQAAAQSEALGLWATP
jgi:endonuclease YncB( thermonuclease family)